MADIKYYKDGDEAKADIPRYEREFLPCLELMFEDPVEIPLYFPTSLGGDGEPPRPFGTLKVKFKFRQFKPMISVGNWTMYTFVDAEVLDVKINEELGIPMEHIIKLFKIFISNHNGIISDESGRYTLFWRPFEVELRMIRKMCNMNAVLLKNVIWNY